MRIRFGFPAVARARTALVALGPCPVLVVHTLEHKPLPPPDQTAS
jgi:hypothetical protein